MHSKIISIFIVFFLIFITSTPSNAEDSTIIQTLISQGDQQLANDNPQQAFNLFRKAFLKSPENVEVNYKWGQAASLIKDYETAVMAFERVLIANPNFVQAKIKMAEAFYYLGAYATAKQHFLEALEADIPEEVKNSISSFLADIP